MPDFDVFSLLEIQKRKHRSHGKRQKGNDKCKRCAAQKSGTSLNNLSSKLREHGQHAMLSFLSSLPIPVLRIFDIEDNRFYDRNHQMYEAALLTSLIFISLMNTKSSISTRGEATRENTAFGVHSVK